MGCSPFDGPRSPTSPRSRGSRPLDLPLQTFSSCPTLREGEAPMCPKKAGTRIEAGEASLRQRCANANAERVPLGLSAYVVNHLNPSELMTQSSSSFN